MESIDYLQTEEFADHDPELLKLNVCSLDLKWISEYRGGEEVENQDILFVLEQLNWSINRLANGRINNFTLDRVRKMMGGWYILPS
jgi:hypothetical protein